MNSLKKIISLVLTLCMLLAVMPVTVLAAEDIAVAQEQTREELSASQTEPAAPETAEEVTVLWEDEALRGEYEKHFLMSDGSYQVEVYAYPVHELVDGVWVEIESTNQNARGDVTVGREQTNILDNFVWESHGVQSSTGLRLYIGSRSGYTARTYIQFATMPTIPAGSTITAATMKLTMVSGTSLAYTANAYQVTGGEWDPTTIQWTNKPAANVLLASNISNNDRTKYQFSVLTAVRHWYDGDPTGQNENYGIMLRYYDESLTGYYNSVYSGDVVDTNSRPKLTISYTPPDTEISVLEGYTKQLPLPDTAETITWTSSNTAVATVNSAGKVTGVKAGKVIITASAGGTELQTYTVYVRIENGVYRIDSRNTNYYLAVNSGALENAATLLQSETTEELPMLRQLWRVTYLSAGYYVIRPMHNQNMALHAKNGISDVTTIGYNNTLSGVPAENRWAIEYLDGGYVFKCQGDSPRALKCGGSSSGSNVFTGVYITNNTAFNWYFEDAPYISPRVVMLDTQTGETIANKTIYLEPWGTEKRVAATVVCTNINNQNITLNCNEDSVRVDPVTCAIAGITPGENAEINAEYFYNGSTYTARCYAYVKVCPDNVYFMRCCAYDRYLQVDNRDSSNDFSTSGAKIEQWAYHGSDYQKWTITYRGDGYYSIINLESGMALTVPSGQTGSEGVYIGQETYAGNERQLWKITATAKGRYKIKAKSSELESEDLVLTVGYEPDSDSNGVYVQQRIYSNNSDYIDEWYICSVVDVGISTDDYSGDEDRDRPSYACGTAFYYNLHDFMDAGPVTLTHHYNKNSTNQATKQDFLVNGAISNNIDFMVYIGHGHVAHKGKDAQNPDKPWGNHIQYSYSVDGEKDLSVVCSSLSNDLEIAKYCLYTSEARFGSSTSDLRWVWMYTCNFLNENEYVSMNDLKAMMTGAHIVMGYGTSSYICDLNAEHFSQYLREGETIINSFFKAGKTGESVYASDNHLQRALYIPQTENETLFSPMIHYEYTSDNVMIRESYIDDAEY